MVKKIILSLFILVLTIQLAYAVDTQIKIKTLPDHKVSIFILKPNEVFSSLESFHRDSDITGEVSIIYSSNGVDELDVLVNIKKNNIKVLSERFKDYKAGEQIYIRIDNEEINGHYKADSGVKESSPSQNISSIETNKSNNSIVQIEGVNKEGEENVSSTGESSKTKKTISGKAIFRDKEGFFSSNIYYIIGGVILVLLIIFFVVRKYRSSSLLGEGPSTHGSFGFHGPSGSHFSGGSGGRTQIINQREVKRLERELESAQREIRTLRNREKISVVEEKLKQDKLELERLKRGG